MTINLSDRDFLVALRNAAEDLANVEGTNSLWARAYFSLADAADRLDGMLERCEVPFSE